MSSSNAPLKCRTCFEPKTDFYSFQDPFENRTMGDLLQSLTKINANGKDADSRLPQYLCGNCSGKLKNAYAFVQQAQRVNEHLLETLLPATDTNSTSISTAAIKAARLLELVDPLNEMNADLKVEEVECAVVGDVCHYDAADVVTLAGCSGERLKRLKVTGGRKGIAYQKAQESRRLREDQDCGKNKDKTHFDPINMTTTHWPPDDDNDDSCLMDQINDSDSQSSVDSSKQNENVSQADILQSLVHVISNLKKEIRELKHENKRAFTKLTEEVTAVKLENRKHHNDTSIDDLKDIHKLPLNVIGDLENWNNEIQNNEVMLKQYKEFIAKTDAEGPAQFIRAAVRKIFSDELASAYSWKGTSTKPSAEKCFLITTIKNICHLKFRSNDQEMNAVLQQHFVHAKDRTRKKKH